MAGGILLFGVSLGVVASPGRRPLVAVISLATAALVALAVLEYSDHAAGRAGREYEAQVNNLQRQLDASDEAHQQKLQSALARKTADYELKMESTEAERDAARQEALRTKEWAQGVQGKLRSDLQAALRDQDAANGRAEAAKEEAAQMKRHADLLVIKAEEIARESGRQTVQAGPMVPPPTRP